MDSNNICGFKNNHEFQNKQWIQVMFADSKGYKFQKQIISSNIVYEFDFFRNLENSQNLNNHEF